MTNESKPAVRLVIALLNDLIDDYVGDIGAAELRQIKPDEAREALRAIETQHLAIGALRLVVENPKNEEALAHAKRVLEECTRILSKPAAPAVDDVL